MRIKQMDFNKILQNKPLLFGIIGGVILFIVLMIFIAGANKSPEGRISQEKKIEAPLNLLTTDNLGKAIEIQALLAREGITAHREADGSKSSLFLQDYTPSQRDRALLAIVKSGIMDEHMGLEIFDKGDFTSTKDDKRIRLARAINGELARLIRKIPPIENASVFISIPEPTIFTSRKKPTTATVQLSIPSGTKLGRDKIRAITNLLLGSVQNLDAQNIAITDTNGNVYSSIIGPEKDMLSMVEENDAYMKKKIEAQLNKLVGKGNYVVTVSTYLRQVPIEKSSIIYDPNKKSVVNTQRFTERLGDQTRDDNKLTQATSTYLPSGLPQSVNSQSDRNYARSAEEVQYGVTKTQVTEFIKPGTIEEISIALTLEQGTIPAGMTEETLQELVAKAASPKAKAQNVKVAYAETLTPYLANEKPVKLPEPEESGNPWWTVGLLLLISLIGGLWFIKKQADKESEKHQEQIAILKQQAQSQENQLQQMTNATSALLAKQEELQQTVVEGASQNAIPKIEDTLDDIDEVIMEASEEELGEHLKSWIEKN